jgi:hypothetical protein
MHYSIVLHLPLRFGLGLARIVHCNKARAVAVIISCFRRRIIHCDKAWTFNCMMSCFRGFDRDERFRNGSTHSIVQAQMMIVRKAT